MGAIQKITRSKLLPIGNQAVIESAKLALKRFKSTVHNHLAFFNNRTKIARLSVDFCGGDLFYRLNKSAMVG
jgi:hypothetical protein